MTRIKNVGVPDSDETLDMNIDDLFKDPEDSQLPDDTSNGSDDAPAPKADLTKTMSERINTVRRDTEKEVLERVAKENGYESYSTMKKAQEEKLIKDHGFDLKDIEAVLEPMLRQRLADDPRFKKLEELERRERDTYIQAQLTSINKITGQQLKMTDLPEETLDLWSKGVELEQAYYATQGKAIISKGVSRLHNGTLSHLAPGSGAGPVKTRALSHDEKEMWRAIVPGITEKELAEKTTPVNKENN